MYINYNVTSHIILFSVYKPWWSVKLFIGIERLKNLILVYKIIIPTRDADTHTELAFNIVKRRVTRHIYYSDTI